MKKTILNRIASQAVIILILVTYSCSDEILIESPPHIITTESLFKNLDGFELGLNGLYSLVRNEHSMGADGDVTVGMYWQVGTDALVTNHTIAGITEVSQFWGAALNALNVGNERTFNFIYNVVNTANTIINYAEKDVNWSGGRLSEDNEKNRVIAEARAIRAWAYRHLTYGWGDVPLVLEATSGSTIRTDWERTPVAEVRQQIIEDLLFAEIHIPVEGSLRGRLTKGAVQHYLAEMYLVLNDPESALYWANKVIDNPAYQLITSRYGVNINVPGVAFMDMFLKGNINREEGNTEALWVWQYGHNIIGGGMNRVRRMHGSRFRSIRVGGVNPLVATLERGGHGVGRVSLTKWALDIYEPQDDRFSHHAIRKFFILGNAEMNAPWPSDKLPPGWSFGDTLWLDWRSDITFATRARLNWPWSRKVDDAVAENIEASGGDKDLLYLRLADTYLLKAESEYLLGLPEDAARTINIIRSRSNASEITAANVNIDFILDERSRELIFEEHRRWTLLRTGKWVERTRAFNKNGGEFVTERETLFPIPQSIIDANITKEMPQNPGF
jgi:starch-binding outer membrane protein, SusD/RagB family